MQMLPFLAVRVATIKVTLLGVLCNYNICFPAPRSSAEILTIAAAWWPGSRHSFNWAGGGRFHCWKLFLTQGDDTASGTGAGRQRRAGENIWELEVSWSKMFMTEYL